MIVRCFGLLLRSGKLPDPPGVFLTRGAKLKIIYTSPIFKSQEQIAANNIMRATQVLLPFQGADPTIMDAFHPQRIAKGVGELFNLNPRFYRSEEELAEIQQQRVQAQMAASNAQQLKDTGIGLNNLASAGETLGGAMPGGMGI